MQQPPCPVFRETKQIRMKKNLHAWKTVSELYEPQRFTKQVRMKKHLHAWKTVSDLYEPQRAVSRDDPVGQQPDDGEINLAEEKEEGKHPHHMHVHAMDLHNPQARCVGVLYAPGLVVLLTNIRARQASAAHSTFGKKKYHLQAVHEPRTKRIGYELVDARVEEAERRQGCPLAPAIDLEAHEHCILAWPNVHVAHVERA
jgi:hypothetical protein